MKGDNIMNAKKMMAMMKGILMVGMSFVLLLSILIVPTLASNNAELKYWVGGYSPQGVKMLREVCDQFTEETGVGVEVTTFPWGEFQKKLISAIKMEQPPDIFEVGFGRMFQAMGALRPLTKEFEGLSYKDSLPPAYVDEITIDGEIWGIPRMMTIWQIMINKEKFEQVGLDPQRAPEDWEDLLNMAEKLTRDTNNDGEIDQWGWGAHGGYLSSHIFLIWMAQQEGVKVTGKGNELLLPQYRDETVKAIELMNTLAKFSPGGPKTAAGYEYGHLMRMMAEEDIAMMITTAYNGRAVVEMNPQLEGKIGFINFPKKPTGLSMAGGGWIYIASLSKYPNEAWELIEHLQEPENSIRSLTLSNFIPCRGDLLEYPLLRDDPWASYMMQQGAQGVKIQEQHPGWSLLREKIMDAVAATLLGRKTVNMAVDDMIKEMELIQKAYEM